MTDRNGESPDGTLERGAGTAAERAHADLVDHVIAGTRAFIDARPSPDLTRAVMTRIDRLEAPMTGGGRLARFANLMWRPREVSLRVRPAYGLLAGALFVGALTFRPHGPQPPVDTASVSPPSPAKVFAQFRLQAVDAASVRLAGSFTNWQPRYELHQTSPGIWTITLPLPAGVHDYSFVVDGREWVTDPYAPAVDDGFGGTNSRIALVPAEDPSL